MTTVYVTHKHYQDHQMPNYQHPEHAGRIQAVWEVFREAKLTEKLLCLTPQAATDEQLLRVHTAKHVQTLTWIGQQEKLVMYDSDTYALPASNEIARLSAGGVITAIETVLKGEARNGLAAVRPPGHHATPSRAMGFCLLSNVAIGARHAQALFDIQRVMIVDFDVHHGNGTQDVFYEDESVLFISTHQYPYYPMTGALQEIGKGAGRGTTLNVPLSAGHGDKNYLRIFKEIIWQAARRFQPQFILVSAGFDAHFVDPLASMTLSLTGYAAITRELKAMAEELCEGKIVFVMEGGYDLKALSHGMRNIAHVLLDEDTMSDPYGLYQGKEPDISPLMEQIRLLRAL